uniref:Uncharacterized LOC105932539 n=1 Tax=Fundulus heteroclitus TaxID=8078 RepID=A0A3Q2QBH0_FUNHE
MEERNQNLDSDSESDSAPYFPYHQLCHLGKKPHECAECGKCFFQASQLQQHQRMHKSEFQCQTCGRGFVSLFALRNHKHTHGKSRPFQHMSTHREESFPCDICNKIFRCKSSRAEHRKTHTASSEAGEYRCDMCYKSFSKRALLKQHQESHVGEVVYECTECDKAFAFPHLLEEHQRSHAASS